MQLPEVLPAEAGEKTDEELLALAFSAPGFRHRISEVAAHTARGLEGGFAAYRKGGSVALSQTILPERDWWLCRDPDKWDPTNTYPAWMQTMKFRPKPLPNTPEEAWRMRQEREHYRSYRRDLLLTLHSHPKGNLAASNQDMRSWRHAETASPHSVKAILATNDMYSSLMMFRRPEGVAYPAPPRICKEPGCNHPADPFMAAYDERFRVSGDSFLEYCSQVGFRAVIARYYPDKQRFDRFPHTIAAQLAF